MKAKLSLDLKAIDVPIVAARPPSDQPSIAFGFAPNTPMGPSVILGVNATLPGLPGLSLLGHLEPERAEFIAGQLIEAAAKARAFLSGQDAQPAPFISEAIERAIGEGPEGPPLVVPARIAENGDIEPIIREGDVVMSADSPDKPDLDGEMLAIWAQVQRPFPAPAASEPGKLAAGAVAVPSGPALIISIEHPEGESLHAVIEGERLPLLQGLMEQATAAFVALAQGAPKGEKVQ